MLRSFLAALARWFDKPSPLAAPMGHAPVASEPAKPIAPDVAQVQHVIGCVSELTTNVAQVVGQHNVSVRAISDELTIVAQNDPAAVASIVCKLLVANQELQGRLERAEVTLQKHSRQLHEAVASARTDGLTGLLNRRALDDELRKALADFQTQARPAALLMLDVDHFKRFNDTCGHVAGDQALIHVADAIRAQSRATDIVARFGGEEFSVIFTAATAAEVRNRAENLRLAIRRRSIVMNGCEMQVTASGGLADLAPGDTIADWVARADTALYAAKDAGRDCGFEMCGSTPQRIKAPINEPAAGPIAEPAPLPSLTDADAALAADSFADTTFVVSIARRIAEWRRGGTTLTVVLCKLETPSDELESPIDEAERPLVRSALRLARHCLREMDLLTRWQSDGLAILLPSTSIDEAKTVARRLRSTFFTQSEDHSSPLPVCIGIAEGIEGNDAKRVLQRAWLALQAARAAGSGSIFIHDGLKAVGLKLLGTCR